MVRKRCENGAIKIDAEAGDVRRSKIQKNQKKNIKYCVCQIIFVSLRPIWRIENSENTI